MVLASPQSGGMLCLVMDKTCRRDRSPPARGQTGFMPTNLSGIGYPAHACTSLTICRGLPYNPAPR